MKFLPLSANCGWEGVKQWNKSEGLPKSNNKVLPCNRAVLPRERERIYTNKDRNDMRMNLFFIPRAIRIWVASSLPRLQVYNIPEGSANLQEL
jgi:hypothetical protein